MTTQSLSPPVQTPSERFIGVSDRPGITQNDTIIAAETPLTIPWPQHRIAPGSHPDRAAEQAQKFELLGRMMTGVIHDLNNVLAVIGGHSELLAMSATEPALVPSHAELICASVRSAGALTSRLLAFAKPADDSPEEIDLATVVTELEPLIRAILGTNIRCVTMSDGVPTVIQAHRDRIERILLNLVSNSRDAMPNGGVVGIRTSAISIRPGRKGWPAHLPVGPYAMLTVADDGSGIASAVRSRIFEPFFTTKGPSGTGLGLANVREIVDLYNGHIEIDSDPDLGTIFRILLPAAPSPSEEIGLSISELSRLYNGQSALVVDDNDDARQLTKSALEAIGFNVIESRSGDTAIRLARVVQEPIDLLVTELVMPGLGGRKLVERLRFSRPGLPVVYVSGYSPLDSDPEPGTHFVDKPISRARFLSAVHRVMQQVVMA